MVSDGSRPVAGQGSRLVLIGGPPGVGKSTALGLLPRFLDRYALLDADDTWRVHPKSFDDPHRILGLRSVVTALLGYLEAGYSPVFLTWVLANPHLVQKVLDGLSSRYKTLTRIYLVASRERIVERITRRGADPVLIDYALGKLALIEQLPFEKIDTTDLDAEEVARRIAERATIGVAG